MGGWLRFCVKLWTRLRGLRPTRDGWWFITVVAGILVIALNTGNNQLYLLLGMLLTLVCSSWLLGEISLRGVIPRRQPPARVHASHPFLMGIILRNKKRRFPSFSIEVEDLCDDQVVDKRCYFLKIPAGRTQQTSYRHSLMRRGRYLFTAFRISTKFPFALFRSSRYVEHHSEVVVYPALIPLSHLPQALRVAVGEQVLARLGRHGNFHALREYRTGDDPRDIHWRNSARRGRLMVREYEVEAVQQVTLFLDNSLSKEEQRDPQAREHLERVISWGASLGVYYLEHGYALSLSVRAATPPLPLLFSSNSLSRLLTMLALIEAASPDTPFQPVPHAPPYIGERPCERRDCLLIIRPGRSLHPERAKLPPEAGMAHVIEAS